MLALPYLRRQALLSAMLAVQSDGPLQHLSINRLVIVGNAQSLTSLFHRVTRAQKLESSATDIVAEIRVDGTSVDGLTFQIRAVRQTALTSDQASQTRSHLALTSRSSRHINITSFHLIHLFYMKLRSSQEKICRFILFKIKNYDFVTV